MGKYTFPLLGMMASLLMIIGTYFRWNFLVDPPTNFSPYYSHSYFKKYFGNAFLVIYNYVLGTIIFVMSLMTLWEVK